MSVARFRRFARLEKLAQPYLKGNQELTRNGVVLGREQCARSRLAFLIRYGNPSIEEPLECATQRCEESVAWKECCHEFNSHYIEPMQWRSDIRFPAHDRDLCQVWDALRHFVISSFPGADEKQKLDQSLRRDLPGCSGSLSLTIPQRCWVSCFPILRKCLSSREQNKNFDSWWGLPRDAFERQPWPYGMENQPLARAD